MTANPPEISVAPMMDWTDRHCRFFLRLIAPHVRLYTEMVTTGAILHGKDRDRFLGFDPSEQPLALQLGGSDAADLAQCAAIGADYGYDEINLNCGCPSDRVQNGSFGACLMKEPNHVADCVAAMMEATNIPVTVKCRIGVDDCDDAEFLHAFVKPIYDAGCRKFIIHARKAWLNGLSPRENREIPPLRYDVAAGVKTAFPAAAVIVNGGVKTVDDTMTHMQQFDGVMIGREAYQNPWVLTALERDIFGHDTPLSRHDTARAMIPYIDAANARGVPTKSVTRHMLGLFQGQRGGKAWRRVLSTDAHRPGTTGAIIETALAAVGPEPRSEAAAA